MRRGGAVAAPATVTELGCTLTETELTFAPCFNKKSVNGSDKSLSLAAAAEVAVSSTSRPSFRLAARTWRASSGGRKSSQSLESAAISRAFATRGCMP
jgi:hypothetical protein